MMLSKPEETSKKPSPLNMEKKAQEVADLERRLADLSTASIPPAPSSFQEPANLVPTTTETPAPVSKPSSAGGKSALLARIMKAQERAKQSQPVMNTPSAASAFDAPPSFAAPPPAMDLKPPPPSFAAAPPSFAATPAPTFSAPTMASAPPPAFSSQAPPSMDLMFMDNAPPAPPAFDHSLLPPPQQEAPPAFDASFLPAPTPVAQQPPKMQFDPMAALAPPSAPAFEDLMMDAPVAMMPPPVQPPPPPEATGGLDEETLQAIMAMDGMSEADKQSLIDEQLKIMKSIEAKKPSPQASAADAFEQRSFSSAVQAASRSSTMQMHGQERTQAAIDEGSAVMVQCTSCENWMQVTGAAQLMFCPNCQTVTPVVRGDGGITAEDADQMAADLRLAEQLQKEEYAAADEQHQPRQRQASAAAAASKDSDGGSWMEWLGFGTPAPAPASRRQDEEINFSRSSESGQTASQQPLFACVTDSINNAANYAMSLQEDEEGNVHGVDASSLLAVPQVGRNTDQSK